jgi:acyl dehydratase
MEIMAGQIVTFQRHFSQRDFDRFAALTRDHNPIHVDLQFSAKTRFGRTVAHGMLLYSTINRVLNTLFPGPGTLQIKQEMMFQHPTYTHTEISVRLEVTRIRTENEPIEIKTTIHLPDGNPACDGKTLVCLPGRKGRFPGVDKAFLASGRPGARVLKHLKIGQSAKDRRTFTKEDVAEYSDLTGDANPLFIDPEFARENGFSDCLIPGPLLSGMFSDLLGTRLPGRGTNWLKQNLHFPAPAYVGDEITATVEIIRLRPEKNLVNLRGSCANPAGELVCQAQSLVLVSDLE